MYYVYVLQSEEDKILYVGYTTNLKSRLKLHNEGRVESTRNRRPVKLIYYEASLNQQDALHREKYLKSSWGETIFKKQNEVLSNGVHPVR